MSDDVAEAPRYSTTSTLRNLLEHPDLQMPVSRLRDGDSKKEGSWDDSFDTTAALLGPNLWDKSVSSYQDEFKMEYVDLDEFFTENGMGLPPTDLATLKPSPAPHLHHHHHHHHHHHQQNQQNQSQSASAPPVEKPSAQPLEHSPPVPHVPSLPSPPVEQALPAFQKGEIKTESVSDNETLYGKLSSIDEHHRKVHKVELKFSPADLALDSSPGEDDFDPQSHTFSEEELKPQPMVKKSRKQFVPDDLKDDRYWARRRKNNLAAKRSRDARRVKENQIALRASFLEKENFALRKEIDQLRKENSLLKSRLLKLEDC